MKWILSSTLVGLHLGNEKVLSWHPGKMGGAPKQLIRNCPEDHPKWWLVRYQPSRSLQLPAPYCWSKMSQVHEWRLGSKLASFVENIIWGINKQPAWWTQVYTMSFVGTSNRQKIPAMRGKDLIILFICELREPAV